MFRILLLMVSLQLVLTGCGMVPTKTPDDGRALSTSGIPHSPKIVLVILENKDAAEALDRDKLPFLWSLTQQGAYLSRYYAVAHPSQPNYIALISGRADDVPGDDVVWLDRPHLGTELTAKQLTWKAYAEDYPSGTCDQHKTISSGHHGETLHYVHRHVPFLSFSDLRKDPAACSEHITGFEKFGSDARSPRLKDLPSFSLVIPNLINDAHDPKLSTSANQLKAADDWLKKNFEDLLKDAEFRRNVLLIITFDENDEDWPYLKARFASQDDNRVYAVLWGAHVLPNTVDNTVHDHYDLLRTVEANFDLAPMAAGDKNAHTIGGIWR